MNTMPWNKAIKIVKQILTNNKNLSVFIESDTRKRDVTNDIIPFRRDRRYYLVITVDSLIIHLV